MTEVIKGTISQEILSVKETLGAVLELVESWIITMAAEEERCNRLERVIAILEKNDGLSFQDREVCIEELTKVIGSKQNASMNSIGYRIKLQALFKEQIEKLQIRIDRLLRYVDKVVTVLDDHDGRENAGKSLIMAQEDERRRIAREIHDGPAQSLASLTMRMSFCLEHLKEPEVLEKEISELKNAIVHSLKDIRRFIFDLRPMALDDLGLIPTLEQFVSGIENRNGVKVHINVEGERTPLGADTELAVFRVIQESVNNACLHAKAMTIDIFLKYELSLERLSGSVKDDGVGFDVLETRKRYSSLKKLGLLSMEERIRIVGGEFKVTSKPGEGTTVSFWVPL